MIAGVRGSIREHGPGWIVVDTGGLEYRVFVPLEDPSRLGKPGDVIHLKTVLEVREDALELYGFPREDQMDLFKILTSVPRVGTRVALRILTALEPAEIVAAVENRSTDAFRAVSGVGEGLAERLVMDLKKKVRQVRLTGLPAGQPLPAGVESQAREALKALGYRPDEIRDALAWVRESNAGALTLDEMVRRALGYFQKGS